MRLYVIGDVGPVWCLEVEEGEIKWRDGAAKHKIQDCTKAVAVGGLVIGLSGINLRSGVTTWNTLISVAGPLFC